MLGFQPEFREIFFFLYLILNVPLILAFWYGELVFFSVQGNTLPDATQEPNALRVGLPGGVSDSVTYIVYGNCNRQHMLQLRPSDKVESHGSQVFYSVTKENKCTQGLFI